MSPWAGGAYPFGLRYLTEPRRRGNGDWWGRDVGSELSVIEGRACQKVGHSRYLARRMAQRIERTMSTETRDWRRLRNLGVSPTNNKNYWILILIRKETCEFILLVDSRLFYELEPRWHTLHLSLVTVTHFACISFLQVLHPSKKTAILIFRKIKQLQI